MAKATVIGADDARVLGHIDDEAVSYGQGKGTVVGRAAHALKEMLGQGYGRRRFNLLLPASRLDGCRIVSKHVVFTYDSEHQLDLDEAPPTYPEHIVDEETPIDDAFL